jgi:hypothetical protein
LFIGWNAYTKATLTQLHEEFSGAQDEWNKSQECEVLIGQMEKLKVAASLTVTNIVALGIGSLHNKAPKERKDRSSLQLAALLTIGNHLGGMPQSAFQQEHASLYLMMLTLSLTQNLGIHYLALSKTLPIRSLKRGFFVP